MDFLGEGLRRAVALLLAGDGEVYGIAVLTLKIGLIATVLACGLGIPVGFVLATRPFWGRRAALTVVNTALAFPTVVVGLLLYGLLSRRGPLGGFGWLYTWQAIVIGDVLLAFPIAAALSAAAVQGVDPRIRRTAETLGAGPWRAAWTVAREARLALAAVITAAFGQTVAEVGAAMIVGGNIRGATRTLTTAVALYTAQGDFGLALALGVVLLLLALVVNVALQVLQGRGGAVVELRAVQHRYEGRVVLDLQRFTVTPGAAVAIVGPNGSGKSTLLRLLALLERPSEGEVLVDGRAAWSGRQRGRPAPGLRRRVTLVEQRPILLRGTVRENLEYGLKLRGMRRPEVNRTVATVGERLGITPLLGRRRHELSDGEVQRVAVARALGLEPDLLLLDEPVSSADRAAAQTLYRALEEERRRRPLAICLASHQLEDAYRWADDVRALAEGRLSPVTPENLFRVELPLEGASGLKHVRVGTVLIATVTDRTGPAILAVPPTDIFVSREPLPSSARNVFTGTVTRLSRPRPGAVHVTADVGVELVAVVTEEATRDLALAPGSPVAFAFKASAVRVF